MLTKEMVANLEADEQDGEQRNVAADAKEQVPEQQRDMVRNSGGDVRGEGSTCSTAAPRT
jgi:hypothetical protein